MTGLDITETLQLQYICTIIFHSIIRMPLLLITAEDVPCIINGK